MPAPPLLSFCSFISPNTTFEQDVQLATKWGFAGLGVGEAKLDGGPSSDDRRVRLLRDSGLRASACVPYTISPLPLDPAGQFSPEKDLDKRLEDLRASVQRLAAFEPHSVIVTTGKAPWLPASEQRALAVEGLREAARVAAQNGTRISVEALRLPQYTDVRTLPEAIELIEEIDEPNVDMAYDIWHLWDQPDLISLTTRHARRIGAVHVSDWLARPGVRPTDRGFAGEGVANVAEILAALERGGFSGWYDVEVFSSTFETMPPDDIFQHSRESWNRTWNAAMEL